VAETLRDGTAVIVRDGYRIADWRLVGGRCAACGGAIAGVLEDRPAHWGARRAAVRLS
jgi:hypothetical protein